VAVVPVPAPPVPEVSAPVLREGPAGEGVAKDVQLVGEEAVEVQAAGAIVAQPAASRMADVRTAESAAIEASEAVDVVVSNGQQAALPEDAKFHAAHVDEAPALEATAAEGATVHVAAAGADVAAAPRVKAAADQTSSNSASGADEPNRPADGTRAEKPSEAKASPEAKAVQPPSTRDEDERAARPAGEGGESSTPKAPTKPSEADESAARAVAQRLFAPISPRTEAAALSASRIWQRRRRQRKAAESRSMVPSADVRKGQSLGAAPAVSGADGASVVPGSVDGFGKIGVGGDFDDVSARPWATCSIGTSGAQASSDRRRYQQPDSALKPATRQRGIRRAPVDGSEQLDGDADLLDLTDDREIRRVDSQFEQLTRRAAALGQDNDEGRLRGGPSAEEPGQPPALALQGGEQPGLARRPHSFAESVFHEGPANTASLGNIADTDEGPALRRGMGKRTAAANDETGLEEEEEEGVHGVFGAVSSEFAQ
jgi:hypothetical protein